ncbi:hypothetical protein E4U55_006177 [Claviceps digitariae]|nr:hypothetical protein E4U55_006177 [Claviceps digitariae]
MKFLDTIFLLSAMAAPILAHAVPNVDGAINAAGEAMEAGPAHLFARKKVSKASHRPSFLSLPLPVL